MISTTPATMPNLRTRGSSSYMRLFHPPTLCNFLHSFTFRLRPPLPLRCCSSLLFARLSSLSLFPRTRCAHFAALLDAHTQLHIFIISERWHLLARLRKTKGKKAELRAAVTRRFLAEFHPESRCTLRVAVVSCICVLNCLASCCCCACGCSYLRVRLDSNAFGLCPFAFFSAAHSLRFQRTPPPLHLPHRFPSPVKSSSRSSAMKVVQVVYRGTSR